jgi:hypothetical protein
MIPISLNILNPANPNKSTISIALTRYPQNDVDSADDDSPVAPSIRSFDFFTSSSNQEETGDEDDGVADNDDSTDDPNPLVSDVEDGENTLNIDFEIDDFGFEAENLDDICDITYVYS